MGVATLATVLSSGGCSETDDTPPAMRPRVVAENEKHEHQRRAAATLVARYRAARDALAQLETTAPKPVGGVTTLAGRETADRRGQLIAQAAECLADMGALHGSPAGRDSLLESLCDALKSSSPPLRKAAAEALGTLVSGAPGMASRPTAKGSAATAATGPQTHADHPVLGRWTACVVERLTHGVGQTDPAVVAASAKTLALLGPSAAPAVPALLAALTAPANSMGTKSAVARALTALWPNTPVEVRHQAAITAMPAVLQTWRDDPWIPREALMPGLVRAWGLPAAPALVATLADKTRASRPQAAAALGCLAESFAATELLVPGGVLPGPSVMGAWVAPPAEPSRLGGPGGSSISGVVEVLGLALGDGNSQVREAAAVALVAYGPAARGAGASLTAALGDENFSVRRAALQCLMAIGVSAAQVPALARCARDPDPEIRALAIKALEPLAAGAMDDLMAGLVETDTALRERHATFLNHPRFASYAVPRLVARLRDNTPATRAQAAWALGHIGPTAGRVGQPPPAMTNPSGVGETAAVGLAPPTPTEALIAALGDPAGDVRAQAAAALGQFGLAGRAAIPELALRLADQTPATRRAAALAISHIGLGRLDPRTPAVDLATQAVVAKALSVALSDSDPRVRAQIADTLGRLATQFASEQLAESAVAALAGAFADREFEVRRRAGESAARYGATALPALMTALGHSDARARRTAAWALGKMGGTARPALPALRTLASDDDERVRTLAREAIDQLET